jgi:hypothetical protein
MSVPTLVEIFPFVCGLQPRRTGRLLARLVRSERRIGEAVGLVGEHAYAASLWLTDIARARGVEAAAVAGEEEADDCCCSSFSSLIDEEMRVVEELQRAALDEGDIGLADVCASWRLRRLALLAAAVPQ